MHRKILPGLQSVPSFTVHSPEQINFKTLLELKGILNINTMHSDFVLPCNCLSSRQFSRVKIVHYYILATATAAQIKQDMSHSKWFKTQTVPGQLGRRRVDHILNVDAPFSGLPRVTEVPHLQHKFKLNKCAPICSHSSVYMDTIK